MKLPALAIATAFASGIACGLSPEVIHRGFSAKFIALLLGVAATSLLIALIFAWGSLVFVAGVASLLCWGTLGSITVCIQEQPRRADHILSLRDARKIDLKSPLRYGGRLADEPEQFPWGAGYDIELSAVDFGDAFVPASGGLRLSHVARADHPLALALHAGDSIVMLTQAKLPQMYRDEGVFDRRAYLSQQGIDMVGVLRAPELLELVKPAAPRMFTRVLRTDRDEAVHILTDGEQLEISCFMAGPELATVTTSKCTEAPNQDQNNQQ
jgi:Domain of unknown function (DUF4131)